MPPTKTALDRLDHLVAEHPHSPASTRVSLTLGDVRDLRNQIERLTAELRDATDGEAA